MNKTFISPLFICMLLAIAAPLQDAFGQVATSVGKTRADSYRLYKDVPVRKNMEVQGTGTPTALYVVQLARFEDMDYIPSTFPKGTILFINQDHSNEKFLYAGFYNSAAEASAAAKKWKQNAMFKGAFPRALPFLVRYD